jgi:hypothetical protein
MRIPNNKVLTKVLIFFLICILIPITLVNNSTAQDITDSDGDGLIDRDEINAHTFTDDADSDDDGVLDGDEKDWNKDTDGDTIINALDHDSDDDGIFDGVEMGVTEETRHNHTDRSKNHFFPDADTSTNTSMIHKDSDGDHLSDGEEDKNKNGKYEKELGETNPLVADRDNDGILDKDDDDIDGDIMTNDFAKLFGFDQYDPTDAILDFDGDDIDNVVEYLGDDKQPGNTDWSDPTDPKSAPDQPPKVVFKIDELTQEAEQYLAINKTVLTVTENSDDDWTTGLEFKWDWGDENIETIKVYEEEKIGRRHIYTGPIETDLTLTVTDQHGNSDTDTIKIKITTPIGVPSSVYDVKRSPDTFNDKKTVRRGGWIAYRLLDVQSGEKITIEYEVVNPHPRQGVRVFVIPYKNLEVYKENKPKTGKPISRDYSDKWQGYIGTISTEGKITITAEKDEEILIIFDNGFYDDYTDVVNVVEPLDIKVSITREESPFFMILMIVILIIVILATVIGAVFYKKLREAKGMTKVTREAAIETQRSLDREMAQLELEIQDSLRRGVVRGGPMAAMPMQRKAPPPAQSAQPPAPRPGASAAAPGTVPQTPAPVGGATPGGAGAPPGTAPRTAPGAAPGAPAGTGARTGAAGAGSTAAAQPQQPGAAPGQGAQQQMLPPAQQPQPGSVPAQKPGQPPQQAPQQTPQPQQPQAKTQQQQ